MRRDFSASGLRADTVVEGERVGGVGDGAPFGGDAVAAGEPVADGASVGGVVGEAVETELHEHEQAVEAALLLSR
jgi:hypothetical protein